ncbi:MAG TPA: RtcB family protein [Bacteroidales bacterium]|nr:RtcB family protein [Bacteroidales bacterium]
MYSELTSERLPIKLWTDDIEPGALQQAKNLANLSFAVSHIAIMPDCHEGFGMPIGGVLATTKAVIPNAVGVDIGCGMCAVKTNMNELPKEILARIIKDIRRAIPLGFNHHKQMQDVRFMPDIEIIGNGIVEREYDSARRQVGSLGGGNHFIEVQSGGDGHIWIMVHSGSRNIGLKVAEHYNRIAKRINEDNPIKGDRQRDLASLPLGSRHANEYMSEMQYCLDFAFSNRKLMMATIEGIFSDNIGQDYEGLDFINIAHNYAAVEHHFGKEVILHRKGATSARKGEKGIIPGSQGTSSYIITGKGNPESFLSCSHGAGRIMGRNQAKKVLDLENERKKLDRKGIIHSLHSVRDLDEAPGAYKNINRVMELQADLVDIELELSPLAVVKG